MKTRLHSLRCMLLTAFLLLFFAAANAQDQNVYTDSLQNGWENWSWAQTNLSVSSPVHGGSASIGVTSTDTWQAAYFHHAAFSTDNYAQLSFWINGGAAGGQHLQVALVKNSNAVAAIGFLPLTANTWTQITIPLSTLGATAGGTIDGFWIQDASGSVLPTYYLDDIKFVAGPPPSPTPTPTPGTVTIQVDALAGRHPINPLIYGTAFATSAQLIDLNAPLNRYGGNTSTSYNWQLNAANHANDWYFESIAEDSSTPGETGDTFIQTSKTGGAEPAVTIPIIDWVAKVGPNREKLASFSIQKYGPQTGNDSQWFPDAGNGVKTSGGNVTGNDPNDANVPNTVAFEQQWVQHLIGKWGTASNGGLRNYILDNEHTIWFSTHRDVTPTGMTMDQLFAHMRDYGAMIKSQDANAVIWAPEEYGWDGYLYSGYDQWYGPDHNWARPDRVAHGNMDYMPWLLQQFKNYETTNGKRLLDVFTLHCYPQSGEFGDDVSSTMQNLRNRSTRQLWDPNYTDESWINDKVKLIPRMKDWVSQYYPGTKIGITEYNWGAEGHINGATAQADIFGIFGREGLDLATRWITPATGSPVYNAMKMYRNYDGNKSTFGDISVSASAPDPDTVSSFAAVRSSDGALTIMLINKVAAVQGATVNFANFSSGHSVQVWQLTSANAITHVTDISFPESSFRLALPPQSITLLVVPAIVLAAPSGLSGFRMGNAVYLNWTDNSTGEDGFVIERASGTGNNFTEVFRTAANAIRYTANVHWGKYTYRIRAVKSGQLSDPSNAVQLGR